MELACEQTDTCGSADAFCQSCLVPLQMNQQERTITKKTEAELSPSPYSESQEAEEDFALEEITSGR